jgi:hypothetical protein
MTEVDYDKFYARLFRPLRRRIGPIDPLTIVAIIGFDAGGPLNFCTIHAGAERFVTYVSCELAVRKDQQPAAFGPYELLATCDNERWVRRILTKIGEMSLEVTFGHGHTLDIAPWVPPRARIQGVVFERLCTARIDGVGYGVLRCVGVTRSELTFARTTGVARLMTRLRAAGVYPRTQLSRGSVLLR